MTKHDIGIPTRTISNVTGIRMETLHYWVRTGLITPSVRGRSGRRVSMLWSISDLVQLRTFARLRADGCSLQLIRKAFRVITKEWNTLVESTVLTYSDGDVFALTDTGDLASVLTRPGQTVLQIMPVGAWKAEAETIANDLRIAS